MCSRATRPKPSTTNEKLTDSRLPKPAVEAPARSRLIRMKTSESRPVRSCDLNQNFRVCFAERGGRDDCLSQAIVAFRQLPLRFCQLFIFECQPKRMLALPRRAHFFIADILQLLTLKYLRFSR